MSDPNALPTIPPAMRKGLTAIAVCSTFSFTATSILLIVLGTKAYRGWRSSKEVSSPTHHRQVSIHTQGYFWLVNLFVADFVQSLGLVTVFHQLSQDHVEAGAFCNFQGFMINSGDIASAIWSFIIAVHTFFLLAGGRRYRAWVAEKSMSGNTRWFLCAAVWVFVIFIGVIGLILIQRIHPEKGPFYDNAGAGWCWIGPDYFWERIFFHYFFLFLDMFALSILYCILFIYIRLQLKHFRAAASSTEHNTTQELRSWQANLEAGSNLHEPPISPGQILTKTTVTVMSEDRPATIASRTRSEGDRTHRRMKKVALTLLCYPIIYIFLTMPLSITRLSQFAGNNWDLPIIYAAAAIFCCSGFINVLLYTLTRKGIISWDWLFRRKPKTTTTAYTGHYPGSQTPATPSSLKPKPSAISITSAAQVNSIKSNIESDTDSTYNYSDNDKLVHQPGCPERYFEEGAPRGSNGSTLIGTCSCRNPPRTAGSRN